MGCRLELSKPEILNDLERELKKISRIQFRKLEPLAAHTSFRVGGVASIYVYPETIQDLSDIVRYCTSKNIPMFIIGYGTNLLVSDDGFCGCVIDLSMACRFLEIKHEDVRVGAGLWGGDLVRRTAEAGLSGLEGLSGVPGGVGGWVHMNCSAFGTAFSDYIQTVTIMTQQGKIESIEVEDIGFTYRQSPGLDGKIVLGVDLNLIPSRQSEVINKVEQVLSQRYLKKIMTLPSCGSTFKNPPGMYAAKLIEEAGCKGMRVGGAEVSHDHANFIINSRCATAAEIWSLIGQVRSRVLARHGLKLDLELQILGKMNDED